MPPTSNTHKYTPTSSQLTTHSRARRCKPRSTSHQHPLNGHRTMVLRINSVSPSLRARTRIGNRERKWKPARPTSSTTPPASSSKWHSPTSRQTPCTCRCQSLPSPSTLKHNKTDSRQWTYRPPLLSPLTWKPNLIRTATNRRMYRPLTSRTMLRWVPRDREHRQNRSRVRNWFRATHNRVLQQYLKATNSYS